jgi:tRNA 2-thiocytidine biosynthesis protein TtcA
MKYTNFEYRLIKDVGAAINKFSLIKENDYVAVALSGGKDSYALLEILNLRLNHIPIKYKLIAVHVDFTDNDEQIQNIKKL